MADAISNVSSAPSAPSAAPMQTNTLTAPKSDGFQYSGPSIDDLFSEFEKQVGLSDDVQADDLSKAKKYEPRTVQELAESFNNEGDSTPAENTEGDVPTNDQQSMEAVESQPAQESEVDYTFEGEIGGQEKRIQFKTKEQLNRAVAKALVADQIYTKFKAQKEQLAEYSKGHAFAQNFDRLVSEKPTEVLDSIFEDMPEEAVKQYLVDKADYYSRDIKEREIEKRLKHAEMLQAQLDAMKRREQEFEQQKITAAREANKHEVKTWATTAQTKLESRIPSQYHEIIGKELKSALLEATHLRNAGTDVTIKTLDRLLTKNMAPYMKLLEGSKSKEKEIAEGVSKSIDSRKQQGLTRLQNATQSGMSAANKPRLKDDDGNMLDVLERLADGAGRGRFRITSD